MAKASAKSLGSSPCPPNVFAGLPNEKGAHQGIGALQFTRITLWKEVGCVLRQNVNASKSLDATVQRAAASEDLDFQVGLKMR
jgi:hypothetical protein